VCVFFFCSYKELWMVNSCVFMVSCNEEHRSHITGHIQYNSLIIQSFQKIIQMLNLELDIRIGSS